MYATNRALKLVDMALDYRAARADMIAGNIANADTPFYRPRDISFNDVLAQKRSEIFSERSNTLKMATKHLDALDERTADTPTLFFRDGHGARNDGNSVDIDVETSEMSKNAIMYNALIAARKKSTAIFNAVLDASAKTS